MTLAAGKQEHWYSLVRLRSLEKLWAPQKLEPVVRLPEKAGLGSPVDVVVGCGGTSAGPTQKEGWKVVVLGWVGQRRVVGQYSLVGWVAVLVAEHVDEGLQSGHSSEDHSCLVGTSLLLC